MRYGPTCWFHLHVRYLRFEWNEVLNSYWVQGLSSLLITIIFSNPLCAMGQSIKPNDTPIHLILLLYASMYVISLPAFLTNRYLSLTYILGTFLLYTLILSLALLSYCYVCRLLGIFPDMFKSSHALGIHLLWNKDSQVAAIWIVNIAGFFSYDYVRHLFATSPS